MYGNGTNLYPTNIGEVDMLMKESYLKSSETDVDRRRGPTLTINVGGQKHQILWSNLEKYPNTRLGKVSSCANIRELEALCDVVADEKLSEIFFDRNPTTMSHILSFYRTGTLHADEHLCPLAFAEELKFWEIPEVSMDPCCLVKFNVRKEKALEESQRLEESGSIASISGAEERSGSDFQRKIWDIMEKPHTSTLAKVMNIVSISFILLSLVGMVLSTVDPIAKVDYNGDIIEDFYPFNIIEAVCVIWFTIEYIVRFLSSPDKWKFIKGFLNFVDLLAIVPYYISLILLKTRGESFEDIRKVLQVFRIMRIFRIFKLARHSTGLQSVGYTFTKSYQELGLLLLFMSMGVLVFSSLAYFAERDINHSFTSIPSTFWWALITMTTVGYGDMVPLTVMGRIIAAICAVSGVLFLAMPIPIIVNNFEQYYKEKMSKEKAEKILSKMKNRTKEHSGA